MLITQNNNGRAQIEMITSSFSNTPFHMFMWIHRKWSFEKICTLEDFKKKKKKISILVKNTICMWMRGQKLSGKCSFCKISLYTRSKNINNDTIPWSFPVSHICKRGQYQPYIAWFYPHVPNFTQHNKISWGGLTELTFLQHHPRTKK